MRAAMLRGALTGLCLSALALSIPFGLHLGAWVHHRTHPQTEATSDVYLNIR